MREKRLFAQWAVMASLIVVGAIFAHRLGWTAYLQDDPTRITYVTLSVFALATAWCGRLSWRLSSGDDLRGIELDLKHGWFASSLCVSIGLIGTAVGYYMMLKHGNAGGDPAKVIEMAFANTAIAIVNTVIGAVCGVLVEIQSHMVEHAVEKMADRPEAEPAEEAAS